jgi:hypothetical protein
MTTLRMGPLIVRASWALDVLVSELRGVGRVVWSAWLWGGRHVRVLRISICAFHSAQVPALDLSPDGAGGFSVATKGTVIVDVSVATTAGDNVVVAIFDGLGT